MPGPEIIMLLVKGAGISPVLKILITVQSALRQQERVGRIEERLTICREEVLWQRIVLMVMT